MKYIVKFGLLFAVLLVIGCNKNLEDISRWPGAIDEGTASKDDLIFDVRMPESTTVQVGDTVVFSLSGNADLVDFYSGAFGNDYAYSNQDRYYDVGARLSFRTSKSPNNDTEVNWNCAKILYSTDYSGTRDGENAFSEVLAATWRPLPADFLIKEIPGDIGDYQDSGSGDVSAIFKEGNPVHLAWHCTTEAESKRVTFRVINTSLRSVVIDDETLSAELYNQNDLDFKWVLNEAAADQIGYMSTVPTVTSTNLQWHGAFNNFSSRTDHPLIGQFKEGYAISKPLELPQFNAGKDKPKVLVKEKDGSWGTVPVVYERPGVYDVVFKASTLHDKEQSITKSLRVTVVE